MGCASLWALSSGAATFTFDTPSGAMAGSPGVPVDAEAVFNISGTTLTITLKDLLVNPTDVGQLLSDLLFHVTIGDTTGASLNNTLSVGQEVSVGLGGAITLGSTAQAGWALDTSLGGNNLHLNVLGAAGPTHLIIGPPGGSTYAAANGSIDNNGPHNPFLNGFATFVLNIPGMTADSKIDSATFSFGTTAGVNVQGILSVPDGGTTVLLLGTALSALGFIRRKLA